MTEWDGLTTPNERILVMGATNRPFDLDEAILRRRVPRGLVGVLRVPAGRARSSGTHGPHGSTSDARSVHPA